MLKNNKAILSAQIIIIDDNAVSRKITETFLAESGYENISFASDGEDAIAKIISLKPALIICDLYMPKMDGYVLCKKIRKLEKHEETPILIQTSATEPKEINKAYVCGANDVVLKPIQKEEFLFKVSLHIQNALFRRRIKEELSSAIALQKDMMPTKDEINDIEGTFRIQISSLFAPSSEVGGDFWGVKPLSHSELAIYNVDLSGHGFAAALNSFRVASVIDNDDNIFTEPDIFLTKLNKKIKAFLPMGQFATMFYGIFNVEENTLKFSAAGCPPPVIMRKNGSSVELDTKGMPLGAIAETKYSTKIVEFSKDDLFVTYSDALTETPNKKNEYFDANKIANTLSERLNYSAQDSLNNLIDKFESFKGDNEILDDLTICALKKV